MKWCEGLGFFFCSLKCNEQKKKYNNPNPTILLHAGFLAAPQGQRPRPRPRPRALGGALSARPAPPRPLQARRPRAAPGGAAARDPPSPGSTQRRRLEAPEGLLPPLTRSSPWERPDPGGGTKANPDPGGGPRCRGRAAGGPIGPTSPFCCRRRASARPTQGPRSPESSLSGSPGSSRGRWSRSCRQGGAPSGGAGAGGELGGPSPAARREPAGRRPGGEERRAVRGRGGWVSSRPASPAASTSLSPGKEKGP